MSAPLRLLAQRVRWQVLSLVALGAMVCSPCVAQEGVRPGDPRLPQAPQQSPRAPQDPLDSVWTTPKPGPAFQGFPVFPSRLSSFGAYPNPAGSSPGGLPGGPAGLFSGPLLPPGLPEPPGWPAWLRTRDREPLPYAPEVALLVRNADRVWWRAADDEPFVPLFFHDKLKPLGPGATIEVRQAGEFELLLHSSSRCDARGPTTIRLVTLDETTVAIDVPIFTRLRLFVSNREHTIGLPDGSKLRVPAAPVQAEPIAGGPVSGKAVAAPAVPPGLAALFGSQLFGGPLLGAAQDADIPWPAVVLLERAYEPGWLGGRATIFNASGRVVFWQHAFGEAKLEPGHRLTFFLQSPKSPSIAAAVASVSTEVDTTPAAVTAHSAEGGQVSWCGARFSLAAGSVLRLDPLQGQPFADPKPATPATNLPTKTP